MRYIMCVFILILNLYFLLFSSISLSLLYPLFFLFEINPIKAEFNFKFFIKAVIPPKSYNFSENKIFNVTNTLTYILCVL